MGQLETTIDRLRSRIPDLRARRQDRLSEADTLRVLITPMLRALGWDMDDVDEVRNEYRHNPSDNPVDYALFLNRTPVLFVEAKALGESLDERRWMVQTINYANTSGVEWCVLTNGNEYRFYKVHVQVEVQEKLFLRIVLDDDVPTAAKARKLSLIGRERMGQRAIDDLWTEWRVDRQVRRVLEGLTTDDAFLRLITRKVEGVGQAEVRASLRRVQLRVDYPGIGDVIEPPQETDSSEIAPHGVVRRGTRLRVAGFLEPDAGRRVSDPIVVPAPSPLELTAEAAARAGAGRRRTGAVEVAPVPDPAVTAEEVRLFLSRMLSDDLAFDGEKDLVGRGAKVRLSKSDGATLQGTNTMYNSVTQGVLDAYDHFVIWSPSRPFGYVLPTSFLASELARVPAVSSGATRRWPNLRTAPRARGDFMCMKGVEIDVTAYRVDFRSWTGARRDVFRRPIAADPA